MSISRSALLQPRKPIENADDNALIIHMQKNRVLSGGILTYAIAGMIIETADTRMTLR